MRAIELNAVAVDQNKTAFAWGRRAAHDLPAMEKLFVAEQVISMPAPREGLEKLLASRVEFLTAYQNAAYAQGYEAFVRRVATSEAALGKTLLAQNVARYLFKLMAYKDEYEVARLHTDRSFLKKIDAMFEGDFTLNYHLAPPLIARKNQQGELLKRRFGPWVLTGFKVLAALRGLRGTMLDVFGRTEERRQERALIGEYRDSMEQVLAGLNEGNHALAVQIAQIPELIKGYGHVRQRNLVVARRQWNSLQQEFSQTACSAS